MLRTAAIVLGLLRIYYKIGIIFLLPTSVRLLTTKSHSSARGNRLIYVLATELKWADLKYTISAFFTNIDWFVWNLRVLLYCRQCRSYCSAVRCGLKEAPFNLIYMKNKWLTGGNGYFSHWTSNIVWTTPLIGIIFE